MDDLELYYCVCHKKSSKRIYLFKTVCFKVVKCSMSNFILALLYAEMYASDEKYDMKGQIVEKRWNINIKSCISFWAFQLTLTGINNIWQWENMFVSIINNNKRKLGITPGPISGLFTRSAKMWNRGFNWLVYTRFRPPNSK